MKMPESAFIRAGYNYEKAKTPDQARAMANAIRALIEAEDPRDRAEARRLIDLGRQEARK